MSKSETPPTVAHLVFDLGCHIIPISPNTKLPRIKWRDGSSNDPEVIKSWQKRWNQKWWAIDCHKSGILLVDPDGPKGQKSWDKIVGTYPCPATLIVKTPHGKHIWYKAPEGVHTGVSQSKIAPGIDHRGDGGYALAPPTPGYSWLNPGHKIADAPEWLVGMLTKEKEPPVNTAPPQLSNRVYDHGITRYGEAALHRILNTLTATPKGQRNAQLNLSAIQVAQLVLAEHLPETARHDLVGVATKIGLPFKEAVATVKSGWDYGILRPDPRLPKPPWGGGCFKGDYVPRSERGRS